MLRNNRLFVYGTLKPDGPAYDLIKDRIVTRRPGNVAGSLRDLGPFPALDRDALGIAHGILYDIEPDHWRGLLKDLDVFEGVPNLFDRDFFSINVDAKFLPAIVYYGTMPGLKDYPIIKSGIWPVRNGE